MVFDSLTFLIFFGIVMGLHYLPLPWTVKKANLVVASYCFYGAWNPAFAFLLALSTVVDWQLALWMGRTEDPGKRKALIILSLASNLGLLGYFKYGEFLLENTVALLHAAGIDYQPPAWDIVLPVGISFYTFQTLSFTIDVYRRRLEPRDYSFLDFALFVSFFPQLVAGPIVRAVDFLPQCRTPKRASEAQLGWGLVLLVLGLVGKTIMADSLLAPVADRVYGHATQAGWLDAWIGTLAFAGQIYFDFASYSICAVGAALCLGFVLPDNFHFPYAAIGFSDFWRRWHISLSTWLRDYLYIPLGGNRKGRRRTYINLALTMLLGGLWHGADWRFVVWGGLHGAYLGVERWLAGLDLGWQWQRRGAGQFALAVLTFVLVSITWVFFRANTFGDAIALAHAMTLGAEDRLSLGNDRIGTTLLVIGGLLATHWRLRNESLEDAWGQMPGWARPVFVVVLIVILLNAPGDNRAFIYFQF